MIGVVAPPEDHDVVLEFFELFKTPWEFRRADRDYDVVLQTTGTIHDDAGKLVIVYGSRSTPLDERARLALRPLPSQAMLSWNGDRIPLYGDAAAFTLPPDLRDDSHPGLVIENTLEPVVAVTTIGTAACVRIGYDLFSETRFLLTRGQPSAHAGIPTLERHIALLRQVILDAGLPLIEVPPAPAGYRFMACLTHDLDHPSIRLHKLDGTVLGFLYRATMQSVMDFFSGRTPFRTLWRNWKAALTLPLIHLGLARDFWARFDRYLAIEHGVGSTFFAIPFGHRPGQTPTAEAPRRRAAAYGAADIAPQLRALCASGAEVGLHGIDAWLDSARGVKERAQISKATDGSASGVRMHWLFFDDHSAERLDDAGFTYDSTFGYNDTVGFRAGTSQVFRPLTAKRLLELPMIVMDTALFYPTHLGLTDETAKQTVWPLLDELERHGGALTVNWHDRSLAPERLWDSFYFDLLQRLKQSRVWCPTATKAVSWFEARRRVRFERVEWSNHALRLKVTSMSDGGVPGLTLRIHKASAARPQIRGHTEDICELTFIDHLDLHLTDMVAI
jgi:hypothetical protein